MIDIIDHILIAVPELDGPVADYTKLTGRLPSWRGSHPGLGSVNALFRFSNTYIELVAPKGEGRFGDILRAHLEKNGAGIIGLAFGVEDAAGAAAFLREKGLSASDPLPGEGADEGGALAPRRWKNVMLPPEETNGLFMFLIEQEDRLALPFAPLVKEGEGRAAAEAIDHVVINTPDADSVIALLQGKLGLRLALDNISSLDEKKRAEEDHYWGITFRYPDLTKARARLLEAGVPVSDIRKGRKKGTVVATPKGATFGIPTLLLAPERKD